MSIFICDSCNRQKDSDFVEYETIDGADVCIFCLEASAEDPDGKYTQCYYCDKWYNSEKHDDCPSISCKIARGTSLNEDEDEDDEDS